MSIVGRIRCSWRSYHTYVAAVLPEPPGLTYPNALRTRDGRAVGWPECSLCGKRIIFRHPGDGRAS